jgi:hypothetical protein
MHGLVTILSIKCHGPIYLHEITHCHDHYRSIVNPDIWIRLVNSTLLFNSVLAIFGSFQFHLNYQFIIKCSTKSLFGVLVRTVLIF